VRRAAWGDGEPVATRLSLRVFGAGRARAVSGRLFTIPREAGRYLRGRLSLVFERQAGAAWAPAGAPASGPAGRPLALRRQLGPGRYRAVLTFAGDRSFRRAVARQSFNVR
jgi:hypothetical protein